MPEFFNDNNNEKLPVKKYFTIAGVVVLSAVVIILFYFSIERFDGFSDGFSSFFAALSPFITGFILAYLLNPIVKKVEYTLYPILRNNQIKKLIRQKHCEINGSNAILSSEELKRRLDVELEERTLEISSKKRKQAHNISRNVGISTAFIVLILIIYALVNLIVPQLITSITSLINSMPSRIDSFTLWVDSLKIDPEIVTYINDMSENIEKYFMDLIGKDLPELRNQVSKVFNGVYSVIKVIVNLIIGLIAGIYIMASKETFIGQSKKVTYAIFKPKTANHIINVVRKTNDIFQNYLVGVLIDSLVVGFGTWILCLIFKVPYAALVAAIVGVTNIIPVFGPFIGAIPSLFFVLVENPVKALILLIIIVGIQQIDGNVIKPVVFGGSVGLSSFWILFSIIIGGHFFGFVGMLLGVPVFAVLYYIVDELCVKILRTKDLPLDTSTYIHMNRINIEDNSVNEDDIVIPKRPGERHNESVTQAQNDGEETFSLIKWIRSKGLGKNPFDLDIEILNRRKKQKEEENKKEDE